MKPAPFTYHDPRTKAQALAVLAARENARLLAGGQSLLPMLNFRIALPDHVIDLGKVTGLAGIESHADKVVIGAMTRQFALEESDVVRERLPLLAQALEHVGHRQTRNRGTIGGSLCHFDPSAELVIACAALDATLVVESAQRERRISIRDWGQGYMTTALAENEMLTAIEIPAWSPGHGSAFVEYARRHGDFAIVGVAVLVLANRQGVIERVSIAVGGCAAGPVRLRRAEQILVGISPSAKIVRDAARIAGEIDAIADAYVPASYRQHLARVLTERALNAAVANARGRPQR
jgi:carbon-monoxide dehydrogenase medium subunit